jgi:hypothetical protein
VPAFASSALTFRLSLEPQPDALVAGFEHWADGVESWRRPLGFIAAAIREHHAHHLASEGRQTGAEFAPLSPRYKRHKDRAWPGRPILTRTGALLAALSKRGSAGHLEQITDTSAVVGIDPTATTQQGRRRVRIATYALAHQSGTRTLPKRPPVRADLSNSPDALGYSIRQILQVEIVTARRAALGQTAGAPEPKMARIARRPTR